MKGPILLVDDEELLTEMMEEELCRRGYFAIGINDGDEAVKKIQGGLNYKFALIDLSLPGTDGREVASTSKEVNPDVPVGCYSGYKIQKGLYFDFVIDKKPGKNDLDEVIEFYERLVE
tara:strand:- start:1222 stop:1575 length:354 start_codon:yes stop_codon:yes gene_type:complete